MKVFLTCPALTPHGGIRVILEWANQLAARGHDVALRTDDMQDPAPWFTLDPRVRIHRSGDAAFTDADLAIISSPHAVEYLECAGGPPRRVAFMQMAEHLFRPGDLWWEDRCGRFYRTRWPLLLISQWNQHLVTAEWGRTGPTHYIGTGVNLTHFPISRRPKDGKTVLVEGWWPSNPSKDQDRIGASVAARLRRRGFRVLAYGLSGPKRDGWKHVPHEFHTRPDLATLNDLYDRAAVLIKATRYDARSCSPLEAMTKGCVTARAIFQGDDDLVHRSNALRTEYDEDELFDAAMQLLTDHQLRERLAENCRAYAQSIEWGRRFEEIMQLLEAS